MSTATKFFKGSFLLSIASIVVRLSGILVLVPLSRLLGVEQLGVYSLVFWIVQSGTVVGRLGVDVAMHRNGAQIYQTDTIAAGRLLGNGSLLMALSFISLSASLWIWRFQVADHWLANKDAVVWLGYASAILLIEGMSLIAMTGLLSIHQFKESSFVTSVGAISRLLFSPLLAWKFGIDGALWGLILASLVQLLTAFNSFWYSTQYHKIHLSCQGFWKESQQILKFGLPVWAGSALISLVTLPIMGEVGRIAGLESLGQLRIAQSLSQIVGFLPSAIAPVAISLLSETYALDNKNEDFYRLRSLHLRGNWLLGLSIITFLSLGCNSLIGILFGGEYKNATPLVIGMGWLALLTIIVENLNLYSLSAGNTILISIGSIIQKIAVISFSFWLIPYYEGMGYVLGLIIGICLQLGIMLGSLWKDLEKILQQQFVALFIWSSIVFTVTQFSELLVPRNLLLAGLITIFSTLVVTSNVISSSERKYLFTRLRNCLKSYERDY